VDSTVIHCSYFTGGLNNNYHFVTCASMMYHEDTKLCTFDRLTCNHFSGDSNQVAELIMQGSHILHGTANHFDKAILTGNMGGMDGNSVFDTLIFNQPGLSESISSNITVNNEWIIQSDPGNPTHISGGTMISIPSATVCADFIYLQNIGVTGSGGFYAGDHSVDLGGNSGWNFTSCNPVFNTVWPGDANYDLVVDNFDLLNIGIAYGDTGYVRASASLNFVAQPCEEWYYQFITGYNLDNADCDGNGIIDWNDTNAITLNYGMTHPVRLTPPNHQNDFGTRLYFDLPAGGIVPGSNVSIPIDFGTALAPSSNVYGFAFTINYNPAFVQPGSMCVDYTGSWVENSGSHLHMEKDFPASGMMDLAFCRINHVNASGYGPIATLHFTVPPTASGFLDLSFSDTRMISANELELDVSTRTDSVITGFDEPMSALRSSVYPNPMHDQAVIHFANPQHEKFVLTIYDIAGQSKTSGKIIYSDEALIQRNELQAGIYFYSLQSVQGDKRSFGKLIIQ